MNSRQDSRAREPRELGQLERLTRRLIQHAARNSPATLSERLEEEWLADLAAQRGALSRLRFALGCCWAMRVIARDYLAAGAAAGSSAAGQGAIILGQHDASYFSRRTAILLLIVFLHALVIYGFATGFARKVFDALPLPMQISFLDQPATHELLPPPIKVSLGTAKPIVPELRQIFDFPQDPSMPGLVAELPVHSTPPIAPSKVVPRILGGPGADFPNTGDYYPLASRRLGETGVATVRVCVDVKGRLLSTPTIAHSSGSGRLDSAALELARAGSNHYRSTTENGTAISDCYPFRIRFQLKE